MKFQDYIVEACGVSFETSKSSTGEIEEYLQYVTLEGKSMLINGKEKYKIKLPGRVNVENLENLIYFACKKYDIDYVSPDNVKERAIETNKEYYMIPFKNYKHKQDNYTNDKPDKNQETKPKPEPVELTPEITKEMTFADVANVLECTVKRDYDSKVITFCGMLLAQTENDQINVSPNSGSSTGKTYISLEMGQYFPKGEVIELGGASPSSFFHEYGTIDKDRHATVVSLKGKILILLENPNYQFLERMRAVLSHDKREIMFKITNRNKKGANRTETIIIEGFCSVFYCTTRINPDEQEQTRMIFISPETNQSKLDESLLLVSMKNCDPDGYRKSIINNPDRQLLVKRIFAIRQGGIREVVIPDAEKVYRRFRDSHKFLLPRHLRDLKRIISLIKAHALLNCFNRKKTSDNEYTIMATEVDIEAGFQLYSGIADSNELGLSPFVYEVYTDVIKPLLNEVGVKRKEIARAYYVQYHKMISPQLLQKIIEQLEMVGLIRQEPDPDNKRQMLVHPIIIPDVCVPAKKEENQERIDKHVSQGEKVRVYTSGIMINEEKDTIPGSCDITPDIIYCPNGCNKAFATQEQVNQHCKDFH